MNGIDFWQFLAGLGLFLFAMKQLEQALASISGTRFRALLRSHTDSPWRAIFSGTLATTIVQSSSLVGLFTLALAGAGMLELRNAVGIILGANLGTTATGWLVATLGFKYSLGHMALPLIAIGALGLSLYANSHPFWRLLLAVGLLLFGLDAMKTSVDSLQSLLDIESIRTINPLLMFVIGALFTAVIQSSSGTMVITLSALNAGLIQLPQAAALIIGADLGTTSTLILGGLPGSPLQRQIAGAHFFFNLITDTLALLTLPLLLWITAHIYQLGNAPLLSLVAIHSSFNVVGIALFLPFITVFARWLQRLFPQSDQYPLQAIPAAATDIAVEALENANRALIRTVIDLNRHCLKIRENTSVTNFIDSYDDLKIKELDILRLSQKLQQVGIAKALTDRVICSVQSSREALIAAKEVKDIREDLIELRHHPRPAIQAINTSIHQYQSRLYHQLFYITSHTGSESMREQLEAIPTANKQQHDAIHQAVLPLVNEEELQDLCPTLFNLNRELYLSNQALREACSLIIAKERLGPNNTR